MRFPIAVPRTGSSLTEIRVSQFTTPASETPWFHSRHRCFPPRFTATGMFTAVYADSHVPPALACLHLQFRPVDVLTFRLAADGLRKALQTVGTAPHIRPAAKPFKGAALDAHGHLSAPHTSRRVKETKDKLDHLAEAINAGFPDDDERGEALAEDLTLAIRFALQLPGGPQGLIQWRRSQQRVLSDCSKQLHDLNAWILRTAERGKAARNVAPNANIALIACIAHAMDWPDQNIAADFCYGFPLLGTATDSGLFRPLEQEDAHRFERDHIRPTLMTNVEYTRKLFKDVEDAGKKTPRNDPTAIALDATTRKEREEKKVLGPEFGLDELWRRFPIWKDRENREHSAARPSPRFGTWQKGDVRAIDDFRRSGINPCWNAAETIAPPSALFPIQVLHAVVSMCDHLGIDVPAMRLALDDVAHAYKRCAVLQQEYCILCYWNHADQRAVFCEQWGLPFGAVASVTGFCRLPHMLTRFARSFFATCCDHYIDDTLQPDFAAAGDSGQLALDALFKTVGIPFSPAKRQAPAAEQHELGVICDLTSVHDQRTASVRPKAGRCEAILATLQECAHLNRLTPGTAKEVFGRLSFCLQSLFGRVGRASALPLVQRCNDARETCFNSDLRDMLSFFKIILHKDNLPCRTFRLGQPERKHVIVYSDASESSHYRGLGLVLHDLEDPIHGRFYAADVCPTWLMDKFLEHGQSSICSLELLAALCLLLTFKERLRGRRVYFFVDNTPAWSCMINGFSASKPMAEMGNLFHLAIAALEIDCWVEWVNSDANIADIPSRPIHQRGQLYAARPVFKQIRMVFPTPDDCLNPSAFFQALRMPST